MSTIKRIVEFIDRHDGLVTALATIALVLATVALVRVTSQLATSTKELRKFAEKQDEKLARANSLSHESYALTQRPFITIKNIETRYDDIRSYWFFQVIGENSGNTPTRAMQSFSTYTENADPDPEEVFQSPEAEGRRFRGIIGPKSTSFLAGEFAVGMPATHIADLATRRKDFYIYGVVHYRDWFSDTSEHITKFCFAGQPASKNGLVQVGFLPCQYWNCADDDCKTDKAEFEKLRATHATPQQ